MKLLEILNDNSPNAKVTVWSCEVQELTQPSLGLGAPPPEPPPPQQEAEPTPSDKGDPEPAQEEAQPPSAAKKKVAKKATRKKQAAAKKAEPPVKEGEVMVAGEVHAIIPAAFNKAPPETQKAARNLALVIHESAPVLQALLPSGLNMAKMHAVTGAALMSRNAEKLARCSRMSILQALTRCAIDGLIPDGTEAYIIPMPNPMGGPDLATYIAKGQGVINRFAEEGIADKTLPFEAFELFEGDHFKYDSFAGLQEHIPWITPSGEGRSGAGHFAEAEGEGCETRLGRPVALPERDAEGHAG